MRNLPSVARLVLALTAMLAAAALACTSDDPRPAAATTPVSPTSAPVTLTASPSSTPWPQGFMHIPTPLPTAGLSPSRAVVDDVTTGNVDRREAVIRYEDIPCDGERNGSAGRPYPDCEGAPRFTLVPVFSVGVCHAVWHRVRARCWSTLSNARARCTPSSTGPSRGAEWGGRSDGSRIWNHRVGFKSNPVDVTVSATIVVTDEDITLLVFGCGPPNIELLPSDDPRTTVVFAGDAFVEHTPYPTQIPTPLLEVTAPRGGGTGVPKIDLAIEAVERHDEPTIRGLLQTTPRTCSFGLGVGGTPCEEGNTEGDIMERFPSVGGCQGGWFRPEFDETASNSPTPLSSCSR